MLISRSFRRKVLAGILAFLGFWLVYTASIIDSRSANLQDVEAASALKAPAAPGSPLDFVATAYCRGEVTSAGVDVRNGIAAADPDVLPEGSVVEVAGLPGEYSGIYTVMDTGPKVNGRHVDLYMWSCTKARVFGIRNIRLTVLRRGWSPANSSTLLVGTIG